MTTSSFAPPIPDVTEPPAGSVPLRRSGLVLIAVAILWALVLPGAPMRSLGWAIALTSVTISAAFVARRDRRAMLLVLAAAALLPWLAVRHSPWLHGPDLVVASLLFLTAGSSQPGEPLAISLREFVRRWLRASAGVVRGPRIVAHDLGGNVATAAVQRARLRRHGAGVAAAIGLSLVVTVLLASGDALFASYLDAGWILPDVFARLAFATAGILLLVAGVGAQRTAPSRTATGRTASIESATITVAALTVTIGLYGVVQLLGALRGADYVANRTGLTYADYARGGFFQTVAVVAITVGTLAVARAASMAASATPRRLVILSVLLTVGTLSLVASTIVKLGIYMDRFGLTMLRLYTSLFACWLALVAVLTCTALVRRGGRRVTATLLASVLVGVFMMNVVDPEALVARHNVERARDGGELDVEYLSTLSLDARPVILSGLAELGLPTEVSGSFWRSSFDFCDPIDTPSSGFSANAEVHAAKSAQRKHC